MRSWEVANHCFIYNNLTIIFSIRYLLRIHEENLKVLYLFWIPVWYYFRTISVEDMRKDDLLHNLIISSHLRYDLVWSLSVRVSELIENLAALHEGVYVKYIFPVTRMNLNFTMMTCINLCLNFSFSYTKSASLTHRQSSLPSTSL